VARHEEIRADGQMRTMFFEGAEGNENDGTLAVERVQVRPGDFFDVQHCAFLFDSALW